MQNTFFILLVNAGC